MRKVVAAVSLAAIASATVITTPREAQAQTASTVSPTGKGIVGCALLGGETVMLIESAIGVRRGWAYILGGVLGAGAGAAGGYFLEQAAVGDSTLTGVAVGSLVLGLGLTIPTTIAMLNATAYRPEADTTTEDASPATGPLDESTTPANGGAAPATTPAAPATTPAAPASGGGSTSSSPHRNGSRLVAAAAPRATGLFDFNDRGLSLAVPAVSVGSTVSLAETRQYGVVGVPELRLPLLSGAF